MTTPLEAYGWNASWAEAFAALDMPETVPARVIAEYTGELKVVGSQGELTAKVPGRLRHRAASRADLPAVGDWLAVHLADVPGAFAVVKGVLPRRSKFSRKMAGDRQDEQVVAANIDEAWIVAALDSGLNLRKLERYLTLARESGAAPAFVLTKTDVCADVGAAAAAVVALGGGAPVYAVSSKTGEGFEKLRAALRPGRTMVLLGPSGVGKSSLINRLAGDEIVRTGEVRESDAKGRHTTTNRNLLRLPDGALLIDTPGMRELQLVAGEEAVEASFDDIEALAEGCRFRDCSHESEPGCAVTAAVASGELAEGRLTSFRKLMGELAYEKRKEDPLAAIEEKRRWATIQKTYRKSPKYRR